MTEIEELVFCEVRVKVRPLEKLIRNWSDQMHEMLWGSYLALAELRAVDASAASSMYQLAVLSELVCYADYKTGA